MDGHELHKLSLTGETSTPLEKQLGTKRIWQIAQLYLQSFSKAPWNEKLNFEDSWNFVHEQLSRHNTTCITYEDHSENIYAFAWGYPQQANQVDTIGGFLRGDMPHVPLDDERVYYIAEVAVSDVARQQGLGRNLTAALVHEAGALPVFMHTHADSPMNKIAKGLGMERIVDKGNLIFKPESVLYFRPSSC